MKHFQKLCLLEYQNIIKKIFFCSEALQYHMTSQKTVQMSLKGRLKIDVPFRRL